MLSGAVSSTGVAAGRVVIPFSNTPSTVSVRTGDINRDEELERFRTAIENSTTELENLRKEVREKIGEKEEMIFEAQMLILEDPAFVDEVEDRIRAGGTRAEEAVKLAVEELESQFMMIDDLTLRQRVADVKDAGSRVMRNLTLEKGSFLDGITEPVIIAADEILPSQAAQLDRERVLAIITEKGGVNSHASIIARSLEIPAIVGIKGLLANIVNVKTAIVDGNTGNLYFDPSPELMEKYSKYKNKPAKSKTGKCFNDGGIIKTTDGVEIQLYANVSRLSELNRLKAYGAEGIGVLRTEFLLMDRQAAPVLEDFIEQFRTVLESVNPKPVVIRLFDLGGDKTFPFLMHPKEANPGLGNRGIRFLFSNPGLLKMQIQAILETSRYGNAKILIPMVSGIEEVHQVTSIIRKMEQELTAAGKQIKTHIPIGSMVETPASAILADAFAGCSDFMSVGSNDLTQYVLAADRENEYVQDIYNPLNPAVLRMLKMSLDAAVKSGIDISVCGEMASQISAIPILLGMGYRRLSVGVNLIPEVKEIIARVDLAKAKILAAKALKMSDTASVEKMTNRFTRKMERLHKEKMMNSGLDL
ncbi:MAG: phosphoenolpyruvate--protein phosphotransferase [Firmicutes bacterium]|nr:phosphoenolpyruvate--protein phosphotransferase [Bacillota bacterium]